MPPAQQRLEAASTVINRMWDDASLYERLTLLALWAEMLDQVLAEAADRG
jgi:hypothetical protein